MMDDSSIFVPCGEEPAPSPQTITVFSGPTQSKHDEVYMTVKLGWIYVGKKTVYSNGKQTQRSGLWFSADEAKALIAALNTLEGMGA